MSKRTCIFVDGENFRKSIVELFVEVFSPTDYSPKGNWGAFYNWLAEKASNIQCERIRTYWYVTQFIDFYPYKLPDARKETDNLRKILSKHEPYKKELDSLSGEDLIINMEKKKKAFSTIEEKMKNRFAGWIKIQDSISIEHQAVEFRRAGAISYNLFEEEFETEKAVDVNLAVDLFKLSHIYDIAVIVSGDQDFVPAVRAVKDLGKTVVNATFLTINGRESPRGAWRLNKETDWRFQVPYKDLRSFMNFDSTPLFPDK